MNFMNGQQLCTVIDIDFKHEIVRMKNYTDRIPLRAFGVVENPSWADFEEFLKEDAYRQPSRFERYSPGDGGSFLIRC